MKTLTIIALAGLLLTCAPLCGGGRDESPVRFDFPAEAWEPLNIDEIEHVTGAVARIERMIKTTGFRTEYEYAGPAEMFGSLPDRIDELLLLPGIEETLALDYITWEPFRAGLIKLTAAAYCHVIDSTLAALRKECEDDPARLDRIMKSWEPKLAPCRRLPPLTRKLTSAYWPAVQPVFTLFPLKP